VALTFTGDKAVIYLDGAEDTSQSFAFAIVPPHNRVYVGAVDTVDVGFVAELPGDLDELRISNVALTPEQIAARYLEIQPASAP
jgi:hypothetical protein